MKSILTSLIIMAFVLFGKAQSFDQGQILLFGKSNAKIVLDDGSPWQLNVGGGYFIMDNICVGIDAVLQGSDGNNDTNFNLFGRYYFMEKFYGGVSLVKGYDKDGDNKYFFNLEGGYIFPLNDYVTLEPYVSYLVTDGAPLVVGVNISIYLMD